jgi:hypothetical protein
MTHIIEDVDLAPSPVNHGKDILYLPIAKEILHFSSKKLCSFPLLGAPILSQARQYH